MKSRSGNRVLLWALGLSIAVHAIAILVMRTMPAVSAAPEQRPMHIDVVHVVVTPRPLIPTPKPPLPPKNAPERTTHSPHAVAHVRVNTPTPSGSNSNREPPQPAATSGSGEPGDPSATGTPAPSPHPACPQPFAGARTLEAVAANAPDDAAGVTGTADVQVTLDASGRVIDTRIYHSTNDLRLDRAAIAAARASTYAPAIVDCQPTGGTYLFRVDFQD